MHNLNYLQSGDTCQNEQEDAMRFQAWKTCLGILGIPFLDVVRVLSAVLLLGNVQFVDGLVCQGERGNCLRNTLLSCKEREREGGMDRKEEINGQRMDDVMKSKWQ